MGNNYSALPEGDIEHLEEVTFFSRAEIIHLHRYFIELSEGSSKLKKSEFLNIRELKYNPFKDRIGEIFASNDKYVSFDDFIDYFSVFSSGVSVF